MKRMLAIVLATTLSCLLIPLSASAASSVTLDLKNGEIVITEKGYSQGKTVVDDYTGNFVVKYTGGGSNRLTFRSKAKTTVTLDNVNISTTQMAVKVDEGSDVKLVLRGANSVMFSNATKVGSAIGIGADSHLTISAEKGTDKLTVLGGAYGAGIGSIQDDYNNTAKLTINSGVIVAEAGNEGAAIGGARNSSANVVINGGSVRATSARNGAAIGAGRDGAGGSVIINGGVVVADGSAAVNSAGIGGGFKSYIDFVEITGGTVTALSSHKNIGGIDQGVDVDKTAHPLKLYITGGSVKNLPKETDGSQPLPATAGKSDSTALSLTKVTLPSGADASSLMVNGKSYPLSENHPDDDSFYIYLPAGDLKLSCASASDGFSYEGKVGTAVTADSWKTPEKVNVTVAIETKNVTVTKDGEVVADGAVLTADYKGTLELVLSKEVKSVTLNGKALTPVKDGDVWKLTLSNLMSDGRLVLADKTASGSTPGPNPATGHSAAGIALALLCALSAAGVTAAVRKKADR